MKRLLISITALALLSFPQFVLGADVDDLKAAYEQLNKAFTSLDAAAVASMIHPGAVGFDFGAAFPTVAPMENTEAQLTNYLKMSLGSLEYLFLNPYNVQFRVVGNTGIVWGHIASYAKLKGAPATTSYARTTSTWIKSGGKWLVLMNHASAIPSGN